MIATRVVRTAPIAYKNGRAIFKGVLDPEGGTGVRKGYCE